MFLNREEEAIFSGNKGEMLAKLMKLIVKLGESFGAEKLIDITSAHTVLNFGLNFVNAAAQVIHEIREANLKVKVRTTADPIIDMDYKDELSMVYPMFTLHDQLIDDLLHVGIHGFTCTPYFLDNRPNFGEHCAWSESSAVIYLNSVIGARSNREGGLVDIACGILGKTSYHGLHLTENRKGDLLFRLSDDVDKHDLFNLTSMGLIIGEIAGNKIPVIEGLEHASNDEIKNLGAASASTGAVALIHVIGKTPEAKNVEVAFQNDKPEDVIEITMDDINEVREKYSTEWSLPPKNLSIGCPHLSRDEVLIVLEKLKGKKIAPGINFWICTNKEIKDEIVNSEYNEILKDSGAHLTHFCPLLTALPRPLITNSAKTCFYSNATYKNIDECIQIAERGTNND